MAGNRVCSVYTHERWERTLYSRAWLFSCGGRGRLVGSENSRSRTFASSVPFQSLPRPASAIPSPSPRRALFSTRSGGVRSWSPSPTTPGQHSTALTATAPNPQNGHDDVVVATPAPPQTRLAASRFHLASLQCRAAGYTRHTTTGTSKPLHQLLRHPHVHVCWSRRRVVSPASATIVCLTRQGLGL